jgi:hypothetical protein
MTRSIYALVCAAALAAGCGARPTTPDVVFPVTVTLQPGQSTIAGGLNLKFVGVSNDSRCPAAAICITSGEATLQFALSANSRSDNKDLQLYHPDNRHTTYEGFSVEVEALAPYPITFNSIRAEDYRVTIKIDR